MTVEIVVMNSDNWSTESNLQQQPLDTDWTRIVITVVPFKAQFCEGAGHKAFHLVHSDTAIKREDTSSFTLRSHKRERGQQRLARIIYSAAMVASLKKTYRMCSSCLRVFLVIQGNSAVQTHVCTVAPSWSLRLLYKSFFTPFIPKSSWTSSSLSPYSTTSFWHKQSKRRRRRSLWFTLTDAECCVCNKVQ